MSLRSKLGLHNYIIHSARLKKLALETKSSPLPQFTFSSKKSTRLLSIYKKCTFGQGCLSTVENQGFDFFYDFLTQIQKSFMFPLSREDQNKDSFPLCVVFDLGHPLPNICISLMQDHFLFLEVSKNCRVLS